MASRPSQSDHRNNPYLSQNQQHLLLAALNSQAVSRQNTNPSTETPAPIKRSESDPDQLSTMNGVNANALFVSPQDAELDNFNDDFTPDLDYLDGDTSFDFENADLGGEMIGALPGSGEQAGHEKRKSPDEREDSEEGDAKRQETQEGERGAKKPGRKPLTNEPTTKRKAQNRAAQRAFRERKEKHVKDLETQVDDLTKKQEADKHEKELLKAHVERLQIELRESRKRLSLNNGPGGIRSSPSLSAYTTQTQSNSNATGNQGASHFQFDFPKFGALPGSQIFGNQPTHTNSANGALGNSTTPTVSQSPVTIGSFNGATQSPQLPRTNSNGGRSMSLKSLQGSGSNTASPSESGANMNPSFSTYSSANNMHGFASTLPQMNSNDAFGDLFSPSILKTASIDGNNYFGNQPKHSSTNSYDANNGGDSTAGFNRVFQFNSGSSASDSASPSNSTSSQWNVNGPNSSCDTSPEPSHGSPAIKVDKAADSFCDKINPHSSFPEASQMKGNPNLLFTGNHIDYNVPSAATFDPVLFGEIRDNNVLGNDFNGGFFDDALNQGSYDFGSPSNLFGILQSPQQTNATLSPKNGAAHAPTPSRNLMAEIDKTRDGGDDDYGLPYAQAKETESTGKLISCNNIWNQLQSNPDFQSGAFDLDSLCSELRAKARCSESGVVVDQAHVNAALKKLGQRDDSGRFIPATVAPDLPPLMFEQESWDNVLKKLQKNGQA